MSAANRGAYRTYAAAALQGLTAAGAPEGRPLEDMANVADRLGKIMVAYEDAYAGAADGEPPVRVYVDAFGREV